LRREIGSAWGNRSIHEINKRDVIDVVSGIEHRGAPIAANKALKTIKTFLRWCVGRPVLDKSAADGIPLPFKETARDRVLSDDELARVIFGAREIGGPYGGIVEILALMRIKGAKLRRRIVDLVKEIAGEATKDPASRQQNHHANRLHLHR
jgi:hypothetical protein